jgi:hypothetical protein
VVRRINKNHNCNRGEDIHSFLREVRAMAVRPSERTQDGEWNKVGTSRHFVVLEYAVIQLPCPSLLLFLLSVLQEVVYHLGSERRLIE